MGPTCVALSFSERLRTQHLVYVAQAPVTWVSLCAVRRRDLPRPGAASPSDVRYDVRARMETQAPEFRFLPVLPCFPPRRNFKIIRKALMLLAE